MNQRIKELIAQAREPLHNKDLPFNQGLMEYSEKFAEQAEHEPVGVVEANEEWGIAGVLSADLPIGTKLYAEPVRTKDLTDDEIFEILELQNCPKSELKYWFHDARAIIAADREKNK